MTYVVSLAPLPTCVAFLLFLLLSHSRDHASFTEGPNMAFALVCFLTLASFLFVRFADLLSDHVAEGYMLVGLLLFGGAVWEAFLRRRI
ncbi:MAG: hypothetical protein P4L71_19875 [Acetobacteraceae bacterium]|nr:hypothetical protein [Acetobacteraceae bacterium]